MPAITGSEAPAAYGNVVQGQPTRRLTRLAHQAAPRLSRLVLIAGFYMSAAIVLPYSAWVYLHELRSFSRIPVSLTLTLLCILAGGVYFASGMRFRVRFLWSRALLTAFLLILLGVGMLGVLSAVLVAYACEGYSRLRERRGLQRPVVRTKMGLALVAILLVVIYPLLTDMYYRGTQAAMWHPDYNKRNIFFGVNRDGLRGPLVPVARSGKARLLFLGDSSPFGWPYAAEDAFPAVVEAMLRKRGMDVEVINAATIGQSDGSIRQQLPFYLSFKPDAVLLMTGIHYRRAQDDYERLVKENAPRDTRW